MTVDVAKALERVDRLRLLAGAFADEADSLNNRCADTIAALLDEVKSLKAENLRLAGEVANRNRRALEGDESKAAFNRMYDKAETLRIERDALARDAARYAWLREGASEGYPSAEGCNNKDAYLVITGYDDQYPMSDAEKDAAIDSAMKGASGD